MSSSRSFILIIALCIWAASPAKSAEPDPAGIEFFEKHIRPVLVDQCYECHSAHAKKVKGRLLLDSREATLRGGEGGAIIIPGNPQKSRLITAIKYADPDLEMPPKHQLNPEQIAAFEQWIEIGAPDPRNQSAASTIVVAPYDYNKARQFWSFQPLKEPLVPAAAHPDLAPTPVDRFIASNYESHRLNPVALADKRTLIRRATYDLTGLPPTPGEVEAFLADSSSDAFEKVVDRLLSSPAYGEQWGRHWLDLVRYADTSGCNSDFPIPDAYRYRNWVIDAFNRDEPYNEFLREQLAGDLLPAKDIAEHNAHVIATGYLAIARRFGSRNHEFHLTIEDVIDNMGKTMLGLSINCARCHDHKFDPIPNSDYYALYGIFSSTKFAFPGTEIYSHPKDFVPLGTREQVKEAAEFDAKVGELDDRAEILKAEHDTLAAREAVARKKSDASPSTQPTANQPAVRTAADVAREQAATKETLRQLVTHRPPIQLAYGVCEGKPADAKIQIKGNPDDLGESVPRGFLTIFGGQKLPNGSSESGRLELAQWITDPSNPLTPRVMVNRIWQHHFDAGIVKTPNDFGIRGQPPVNPALLDYLASQFVKSGWSIKSMQRMIMLSRTYQLASNDDSEDVAIDAANDFLWRQNSRRLSAEEIRDSILAAGDSLDHSPGGPAPFPPQIEWKYSQHRPFVADYPTDHRSVYLMQQRIRKQPFLAIFDGADTNAATGVRALSTTAIQALFMMNDPLMEDQAAKLADRVTLAKADEAGQIDYAFKICLNRAATADELQLAKAYLRACGEKLTQAGISPGERDRRAMTSYMHVLLSSDEFIFLD